MLHEIAAAYEVEWSPDIQALEAGITDHSNPERLGSIAKIDVAPQPSSIAVPPESQTAAASPSPAPSAAALPASVPPQYPVANVSGSPSGGDFVSANGGLSPYPGTLNLIVHRGRNILNLASQSDPHDLYVRITNLGTQVRWQSAPDPHGGGDPIWLGNARLPADALCHFPLSVRDPNQQVQVEVLQQNKGTFAISSDKILGSAVFYADALRNAPGLQWYALFSQNMQAGYLLMATQFLPLNATVLSQEELNRQQMWIAQEQQHQQMQMQAAAANGAVSPMQQIPGGPQQAYLQPAPAVPPTYNQGSHANGNGSSGRDSLSQRVGGLFNAPPDSPPHNLAHNLSDVVAGRVKPQQQQQQQQRVSIDDGHEPGGRAHNGGAYREEKSDEPQPLEYNYDSPESVFTEFPAVPSRAAGGGAGVEAKGAARPGVPAPASASSVAAADDPDGDLEARLRRLQ